MSLDQLSKELLGISQNLENGEKAKKFLKSAAKKLKKKTFKIAKTRVGKVTGNYENSIKDGKVYKFDGNYSCRVYSTMPHAHLIEYGHIILDKNGKEKGFSKEYKVFESAAEEYQDNYEDDIEKFIDEIIGEL